MVLREVIEAFTVIELYGWPILLIDDVFCDIGKVLWVNDDLLKFFILAVDCIDQIYQAVFIDTFDLSYYVG